MRTDSIYHLLNFVCSSISCDQTMAESESQYVAHIKAARGLDEDAKGNIEPVTAEWRVEVAVKTRWSSIRANPKIIIIALFAS